MRFCYRKHFRPKSSISDDDNQEPGVSASDEYNQLRRDNSLSRPSSENSVLDFVKNLIQEEELFEMQRKQLERLKPEDSQPVVVLVTDHSYSSLPTSCFNIASTSCKTPAQYHIVSAELSEENCSPTNSQFPVTTSTQMQSLETSSITTSIDKVVLTNGPVADSKCFFDLIILIFILERLTNIIKICILLYNVEKILVQC